MTSLIDNLCFSLLFKPFCKSNRITVVIPRSKFSVGDNNLVCHRINRHPWHDIHMKIISIVNSDTALFQFYHIIMSSIMSKDSNNMII